MAFLENENRKWWQWRLNLYAPAVSTILLLPSAAAAVAQVSGACSLINALSRIAQIFSYAIGLLAVIILLYAGFLFLVGAGNEETIKKAKTYLIFGLVGLAVAMLAFSAVPIATSLFPGSIVTSCPTG